MSASQRIFLYCLVSVIVIVFLQLTGPSWHFHPRGVFLPVSDKIYQATAVDQVSIGQQPSSSAQLLGHVNVELHFRHQPNEKTQEKLMDYAKVLASQAGGDQLVVEQIGYTQPGTAPHALMIALLQGTVFKKAGQS